VPLTLTIPALCVALFAWVAGWLADRIGRRRLLLVAVGLYAVLGVAPTMLDSLGAIFATRVGLGLCEAVIITVTTTLLGDLFSGEQRTRWLANQTAVASLSALVLFVIGGAMGVHGWRTPFLVYLVSLVMLFGIWRYTWEPAARAQRESHEHHVPLPWKRLLGMSGPTRLPIEFDPGS